MAVLVHTAEQLAVTTSIHWIEVAAGSGAELTVSGYISGAGRERRDPLLLIAEFDRTTTRIDLRSAGLYLSDKFGPFSYLHPDLEHGGRFSVTFTVPSTFELQRIGLRLWGSETILQLADLIVSLEGAFARPRMTYCANGPDAQEAEFQLPILMYHRIADEGAVGLAQWRLSPRLFEQQLDWLKQHGYRSIDTREWLNALSDRHPPPGRPVLITFDDGYADFADKAWPLLQRYGFTATVFIVTDNVGGTADWDARLGNPAHLMDWDTIRELSSQGVEFGSHTTAHQMLTSVSQEEVDRAARHSREMLQAKLRQEIVSIAYPWGAHNAAVREVCENTGYRAGFTTETGFGRLSDDPLATPRIEITSLDGLDLFVPKLIGRAELLDGLSVPDPGRSFIAFAKAIHARERECFVPSGQPETRSMPDSTIKDTTVILTSCNRFDLLKRTLESFRRWNTDGGVKRVLVVEDGEGDPSDLCRQYDAEVLRIGRRVLVWLRAWTDTNAHPIAYQAEDGSLGIMASGFAEVWHGFTFNPSLRRLSDYRRLGSFARHWVEAYPGEVGANFEAGASVFYHQLGFRAAILDNAGYVRHIGYGRHVTHPARAETGV